MTNFSTKQYSYADITLAIGGKILAGATAVEYSEKQNKEALYGRGNKPYAIQSGNVEYEGKIEIWQSELEALIRDAAGQDILKLDFDLVVNYAAEDGPTVTDILKGCQFTEFGKNMSQGDTHMKVELPIMFIDLQKQR